MSNYDNVMVIDVNVSKYEGRKCDKPAGKQLDNEKNVRGKGYTATKPACDAEEMNSYLEPYKDFQKFLKNPVNCLPIGDNRYMFEVDKYQEMVMEADKFKQSFEKGYTHFCDHFDEIVEKQKWRLNDAWDINDYPKNIWKSFGCKILFTGLPDTGTIRRLVGLPQDEVEKLVKANEEAVVGMFETAMKTPYRQVVEVVSHMAKTLAEDGARFKNSLVDNITELVDLLPRMNITKSKELDDLANKLKSELCTADPDVLRYDLGKRREVCEKAEKILSDLEGYF